MSPIEQIMRTAPVIPVLVLDDAVDAAGLAGALVAGGLRVIEVTLRTPAGLRAIREMKQVPGAIVGAGTVLNTVDLVARIPGFAESARLRAEDTAPSSSSRRESPPVCARRPSAAAFPSCRARRTPLTSCSGSISA